jgi:hypothetical protein
MNPMHETVDQGTLRRVSRMIPSRVQVAAKHRAKQAVAEYKSKHTVVGSILGTDDMRVSINRGTTSKQWDTWTTLQEWGVAKFWRTETKDVDENTETKAVVIGL